MKNPLFFLLVLFPWCLRGQIPFTRITDPANPAVAFTNTGAGYKGAVWIDLNNDHRPDLFASQKFLFLNQGGGQFTQLTDLNGATLGQAAAGSSWGDIDNDGDLDCITASTVCGLHYNNGDNTFSLENSRLPGFENYRGWDCSLVDADNNGLLDLFFAHADNFPPGSVQQPCKFYLQVSAGNFQAVTDYDFATLFNPYTIPVWTDYDLDGDMDLFIGTGPGGSPGYDFCYRNMLKENGAFSLAKLTDAPFNSLQDGQVYNAIDFDNDGDMDICLTNYSGAPTRFYRNESGELSGIQTPFTSQSPFLSNAWGDIDNDGDLDVLISSDTDPNVYCYRNTGGVFETAITLGSADNGVCGITLADYDNDGDLDIYTNGSSTARALFRNDQSPGSNHWLACTLEGQQSNRSAIGARVRVRAIINGQPVWQIREVNARNSFQSQNDLRQHFGLGNAVLADSIEISWPSGLVQTFGNLAADNFYLIREGQAPSIYSVDTRQPEAAAVNVTPNPFGRQIDVKADWKILAIQLFDSSGQVIAIQSDISDNKARIRLTGNPSAGNYFLKVMGENGRQSVQPVMRIR